MVWPLAPINPPPPVYSLSPFILSPQIISRGTVQGCGTIGSTLMYFSSASHPSFLIVPHRPCRCPSLKPQPPRHRFRPLGPRPSGPCCCRRSPLATDPWMQAGSGHSYTRGGRGRQQIIFIPMATGRAAGAAAAPPLCDGQWTTSLPSSCSSSSSSSSPPCSPLRL